MPEKTPGVLSLPLVNPTAVTPSRLVATPGALALAREVLRIEAQAVAALSDRINADFSSAVDLLLACSGRVVVSGVGKSGHIARKIAATFASTGTPSLFMHAAEAAHGDLGMITRGDVVLALSYSGEGDELLTMLPVAKRLGTPLIAITGNPASALARLADAHIDVHVEKEACPLNLAPTSSTTAMLAMGDALAIACLDARGFGPDDFARAHPGGALGRKLLTYVRDIMRTGDQIPSVGVDATVMDALHEITRKQVGVTAIVDERGELAGLFTDGDLRRLLEKVGDIREVKVAEVMTRNPLTIAPDVLAAEAAQVMERHRKNVLLAISPGHELVGVLSMPDLLAAKVI